MVGTICRFAYVATSICLSAAALHASTLRLTSSADGDAATQAFIDQLTKSPLLAAADLQIQSYPAGSIVAPGKALDALQKEVVDLALVAYFEIAPTGREAGLEHVSLLANPAIVAGPREQFAVQDSIFGDRIVAELGKRQLASLAFWNRTSVGLVAKKPVNSLEDLKGQRIASFDPTSRGVVVALGAQPTALPAGEIIGAVERGLLDASEFGSRAASTDNAIFTAYQGGTLLTNFRQPLGFLLAHHNTWLRITQQQRDALAKAAKAAEQSARTSILADEERLPRKARENQIQLINFTQIGKPFIDSNVPALWLKQTGDAGGPVLNLLNRVKLDMSRPQPPQRGGAVQPPQPATVLFATIRNDENKNELASRFGIKRVPGPTLSCGTVAFSIPAGRMLGEAYDGSISIPAGSSVRTGDSCYAMIGDATAKSGGSLIVYVHGFNNPMDFAIGRAISAAADLGVSSPVLVWSWPSAGHPGFYDYDEDSVNWSRLHFQDSVRKLLGDARIDRLTLVSHSMVGRLALMGLEAAHGHARKEILRDAIFVAPDVIVPDFLQHAGQFGSAAGRLTLYATTNDWALQFSLGIHKDDLAGLGGAKIVVLKGVDSVDATEVESFWSKNHAYAFEVPEVINDLKALISKNLGADKRALKPKTKDSLPYWLIPANQ